LRKKFGRISGARPGGSESTGNRAIRSNSSAPCGVLRDFRSYPLRGFTLGIDLLGGENSHFHQRSDATTKTTTVCGPPVRAERKNYDAVYKTVGYFRFDTAEAYTALAELYRWLYLMNG
jgi:hypothetical protein